MCLDLHVTLPTVATFMLLYSLRGGSIAVLIWTSLRSFFCLFFFVVVILEGLVKRKSPFGQLFIHSEEPTTEANIFHLYYCSIILIIAEAFLLVFCFYLGLGLLCAKSWHLTQFLTCRFIVWLLEITNLTVLTLVHKLLIGWYLSILMFIVLEFYGFIVVYSYYKELCDCQDDDFNCKPCF